MTRSLGIDIGGTKTAYAVVDALGKVLATDQHPTHVADGFDAVIARIAETAQKLIAAHPGVIGVGVGCPGYVDTEAGVVVAARNLAWERAPLRDALAARLNDLPVYIENDVKVLALGEMHFTMPHARDLLFVAPGTGLSGAIIANGRLVHGSGSVATEIGQVRIPASWGYTGTGTHLEDVVSGSGIVNIANWLHTMENAPATSLPQNADAKAILAAANTGDALAVKALETQIAWLNEMIMWMAAALNPSDIVIAGGFGMAAVAWILPAVEKHLATMAPHLQPNVTVSKLTNPAVGAAALPLQYASA